VATLLEMLDIEKQFPGVRALDGVSFDVRCAEVHALVGENGAGKSTLIKVLSGVWPHGSYRGQMRIDNCPCRFASVKDSETAGVAVIFQELSLVGQMTVAENIFLGNEPTRFGVVDADNINRRARELLAELGAPFTPDTVVCDLPVGSQQLVEIAKALAKDARILVLDEPTAALTHSEVEALMLIMKRLRKRGVGLIYISHRLEEVFRIADRVTVFSAPVSTEPQLAAEKLVDYLARHEINAAAETMDVKATESIRPQISYQFPGNTVYGQFSRTEDVHFPLRDMLCNAIDNQYRLCPEDGATGVPPQRHHAEIPASRRPDSLFATVLI